MSLPYQTMTETPFNAETPLSALLLSETPVGTHYVRSHADAPQIDALAYRLQVGERALSLSELAALPRVEMPVTLECAGNGRVDFSPPAPGLSWHYGGVSTARWSGWRLSDVLELAGVSRSPYLRVCGAGDPLFERLHAWDQPAVVADQMNSAPLSPEHGAPLRLLVPGWYAMASVKWMQSIQPVEAPFESTYQTEDYVYRLPDKPDVPVTLMRVKAIIAQPLPSAEVSGVVEVRGVAYSGTGPITSVEIRVNDGEWQSAQVEPAAGPHVWQQWSFRWTPQAAGPVTLAARAADAAGNEQPEAVPWNMQGYGNNAYHRVTVTVRN